MPVIVRTEPTRKEWDPEFSTKLTPRFDRAVESAKKDIIDKVARKMGKKKSYGFTGIPKERWPWPDGK